MDTPTPAADAAPGEGAPASAATPAPEASAAPEAPECQPIEAWAAARGTHPIWFRSAFVRERWCEGLMVTAEQYDQAVDAAENEVCR